MVILPEAPKPPIDLEPNHGLLFAYGLLQPGHRPPGTAQRAWPDRVLGSLYDLGPFPAAVAIGSGRDWFHGFVIELAESELADVLDPYEEVHQGVYRRIRTRTESGCDVWIYEYARPLPPQAFGPIDRWPPLRPGGESVT